MIARRSNKESHFFGLFQVDYCWTKAYLTILKNPNSSQKSQFFLLQTSGKCIPYPSTNMELCLGIAILGRA